MHHIVGRWAGAYPKGWVSRFLIICDGVCAVLKANSTLQPNEASALGVISCCSLRRQAAIGFGVACMHIAWAEAWHIMPYGVHVCRWTAMYDSDKRALQCVGYAKLHHELQNGKLRISSTALSVRWILS
jgi:hypothetical protein